jgi:hypothetical protein
VKARLLLAEAATAHPDGTISMLRAGITNVWGEKAPVPLQASLVTRIEADPGDVGKHGVEIFLMDADGKEVMPKLSGEFEVARGGGHNNIILNFQVQFPSLALFQFVIRIDNVQYDVWTLRTAKPPAQGAIAMAPEPPSGPPPSVH